MKVRYFLACLLLMASSAFAGQLIIEGAPAAGAPAAATTSPVPANTAAKPALGTLAPAAGAPAKTWRIRIEDVTLSAVFARWGREAGISVRWDVDRHLLVDAPGEHAGSFEDAITQVLESPGVLRGSVPLEVCFYPNTPPLARITRLGAQKEECK